MKSIRILLAEDNLGDILLVQEALGEHHIAHDLYVVRDGEEALHFLAHMEDAGASGCPDLLLLDVNLPRVDGSEVLTEFRKHPQCAQTPVIVISSSDTLRDRERMAALGVTRYFRKPSDLEEFLGLGAVIREVLEGSTV